MHREPEVVVVNVFTENGGGGNPCPIVLDARSMTARQMQAVASSHGHESAFLLPAEADHAVHRLRYFVPTHEMEMCGHATLGTGWLLRTRGLAPSSVMIVQTLAGDVTVDLRGPRVRLSQPCAEVSVLDDQALVQVLQVLGIASSDLASPLLCNASTSRPKTLIHVRSTDILHRLSPRFGEIEALCERLGSTGLYPFAVSGLASATLEARQFPKASGYPEDAATGIAATALFGALGHYGLDVPEGNTVSVLQGRSMGRLSRMCVMQEPGLDGLPVYWLSGDATLAGATDAGPA